MSRLGFKSVVYHDNSCLGELDTIQVKDQNFQFPNNEIRIQYISPTSERCPPLSILQTISSYSVRCKLESTSPVEQSPLINLHIACFHESKTAVVLLGDEEIHLVAMPSKQKKFPCFWCVSVPARLYAACLGMLNLRCLSIVFDLDETLIVANTMKSFEDRIEVLRGWIARETDPIRVSGMSAELKRYVDDRTLLKQYADNDIVVDNGKVLKVQLEEVHTLSDGQGRVVRPVIRIPERNIVLTRINPEIRDTSVLVRLRPAWEDLRSYLTAKGRKRFEVYVCTMAERDYALEIWRLLDPGSHLIAVKQLPERVVCVKSGARKSLLNVFQGGNCHPKMAMVIDDRLKVWEDKDQPRVHVVPAFTPYYAPQAETANAVPVLCVARNVACNVRGCYFKEFDENLLRRICDLVYEDEVMNLPSPPDVSNYLMSEDASFVPNGHNNAPISEGINGPEVAQRLDEKNVRDPAFRQMTNIPEMKSEIAQLPFATASNVIGHASLRAITPSEKPSLLGAPFRRDSIFPDSDPDVKRRSVIMNHGQDVRYLGSGDPPLISRFPGQLVVPPIQPQGGWLVEEGSSRGHSTHRVPGTAHEFDALKPIKLQPNQNPISHGIPGPSGAGLASHAYQVKGDAAPWGHKGQKQSLQVATQSSEVGVPQNESSSNSRDLHSEDGKLNSLPSSSSIGVLSSSIGVLQEIGRKCSSKVEFRSVVSTSKELQFSVEVLFNGDKLGFGMGKTRKDAHQQAADSALRSLADKYISFIGPRSGAVDKDFNKLSLGDENGFLWDITTNPTSSNQQLVEDGLSKESTSEATEVVAFGISATANQQVQKRVNSPRSSCIMKSLNPLCAILDTNKLIGFNYLDWVKNLKLVLAAEKILYVLDTPKPAALTPESTDSQRAEYDKWVEDDVQAKAYVIASMSSGLQRKHENLKSAADIVLRCKELYEVEHRHMRFELSKQAFRTTMKEGTNVSDHVHKMIGYMDRLEDLDLILPSELQTDIILSSLPESFGQFVSNFYVNDVECTLTSLLNMLVMHQKTQSGRRAQATVMVASSSRGPPRKKAKTTKAPEVKKPLRVKGKRKMKVAQGSERCFHCNGAGHWKRNCPKYLEEKKKGKRPA